MNRSVMRLMAVLTLWIVAQSPTVALELWTGPTIGFTNYPGTDSSLPSSQDRITADVWLTRNATQGIFNAAVETHFTTSVSPVGTEWAYGSLSNYSNLTYNTWVGWFGGPGHPGPGSTVGQDAVLHLTSDDIYIAIRFTSFGGSGGGFSYVRSTPATVPEPSCFAIASLGIAAAFLRFRRARR